MTGARPLATGTERPVFLDETGRRARRVRAVCTAGCAAAVLWLAAIVGGSFGFGRLPPGPAAFVLRAPIVVAHAPIVVARVHRVHVRAGLVHHRRRSRQRRT
jgi:hypothetical protein